MSRPLRIEYPDAYYHVMNRGLAYQKIFTDRVDREFFLNLLGECHQMWGIERGVKSRLESCLREGSNLVLSHVWGLW